MIPERPDTAAWLRVTNWSNGATSMKWAAVGEDDHAEEGDRWVGGRIKLFDFPLMFGYQLAGDLTIYYIHKDLLE